MSNQGNWSFFEGHTAEFALRMTEAVVRSNPDWKNVSPGGRLDEIYALYQEAIQLAVYIEKNGIRANDGLEETAR